MSFVGYKYARQRYLDLSLSSGGFEPVEGAVEDDEPLLSPYNSGDAESLVSESPSASWF